MKGASNERKRQDQPWPKGIYFERSAVSHIDGSAGTLSYRGYSIDALATQSTFEEVSYLLIYGDLPTQAELADFDAKLKDARELPASVYDVIRATKDGHPMDVLRTQHLHWPP